jgi:hypothetical protein
MIDKGREKGMKLCLPDFLVRQQINFVKILSEAIRYIDRLKIY